MPRINDWIPAFAGGMTPNEPHTPVCVPRTGRYGKSKASERLRHIHNLFFRIFLCSTLISVVFLVSKEAHAGLLVNRTLYLGLTNGLVGHWSFDGPDMAGTTAYDRSGQGNNGTLTNGPVRAAGKLGQGLDFGFNQSRYVNIGSAVVSGYPFSMCGWFNVRSGATNGDNTIVAIGDVDVNVQRHYLQARTDLGNVLLIESRNGGTAGNAQTTAVFGFNKWHHACAVFTAASSRTVYLDGGNSVTNTTNVTPINLDTTRIGRLPISIEEGIMNGLIDDVRIYNRVLTADEIKRLYNIGR